MLIRQRNGGYGVNLEKIEMQSLSQCEEQAKIVLKKFEIKEKHWERYYACVTGK